MPSHDDVHRLSTLRTRLLEGDISRRGFLTAAMGLSATALLAGCAGGLKPAGARGGSSTEIPLYTVENDPATLAFYNMVIAKFEKDHPGYTVKVTVYSDSNQLQYLTTAVQNGIDLGIFAPPVSSFPDFQAAGHLADITGLVRDIGEDDFLPGTRMIIDGRDYGMPMQSNSSLVYARKDLLDEAGLGIPRSFEEYLNAVRTLHGRNGIIGIASGVGATPQLSLQFFTPYLYQQGVDYFDQDGECTFDRPEARDAVKNFTDILRHTSDSMYNCAFGDIANSYTAGRAAFATFPGRLGAGLHEKAKDVADATVVMPIPAGPFETAALHFGSGQQYGVHANTGNLELATEFLKRLTTGDDAVAFALTVPGHLLPALKSTRDLLVERVDDASEGYLFERRQWMRTFIDNVATAMTPSTSMGAVRDGTFDGKISNLCPWAADVWPSPALDTVMFQDILIKGIDVDTAWRDAAARIKKVGDDWRAANPGWTPEVTR